MNQNAITVTVGIINKKLTKNGQAFKSTKIINHPQYNPQTYSTTPDIALIKIDGSFKYNKNVKAIGLYLNQIDSGSATVAGWGYSRGKTADEHLRYLKTKIIPLNDCGQRWGKNLQSDKVCILSPKGKGICDVSLILINLQKNI